MKKVLLIIFIALVTTKPVLAEPLPPQTINTLIKKFAPLVRYCASDESSPTSVPWYIERCALKKRTSQGVETVYPKGKVTSAILGTFTKEPPEVYFLDPLGDKKTLQGESFKQKISDVECYVNVVDWEDSPNNEDLTLQYIFFWAYQGPLIGTKITDIITKTLDIGIHEGDWEHINVYLKKEGNEYVLKKVFFSRHQQRKGILVYKKDLELVNDSMQSDKQGTHTVVYAACNSHASYPHYSFKPSKYLDVTSNSGPQWRCWKNPRNIGNPDDPLPGFEWIKFVGSWGSTLEQSKFGVDYHGNSPEGPAFGGSFLTREKSKKGIETVIKGKEVDFVMIQPTSLEKRKKSNRFSDYFNLVPPARYDRIEISIEHPQKEAIVYEIWEKKALTTDKNLYGAISGKEPKYATLPDGCLGDLQDACKNLYVANVKDSSGKPLKTTEKIKLFIKGMEY